MIERLVAIGHVVEDTAKPENVIGGGVSYAGIAARNLGYEVGVVTKVPEGHRFLDTLAGHGIQVLTLPTEHDGITTFTNAYGPQGERRQVLLDRQEDIAVGDLKAVPSGNFQDAVFLVTPVIDEVDPRIIPYLSRYGMVVVTPQGYFRDTKDDGTVFQKEWRGLEGHLSAASITVLSEEDIAIGGVIDEDVLAKIRKASPITVLTKGRQGAAIFHGNNVKIINAFPLAEEENRDFTGAGDVFAAAFVAKYLKTQDIVAAGVFAAYFSAVKIAGLGGRGVDSIPSLTELDEFSRRHAGAVKMFLSMNRAGDDALSI